MKEIALAKSIPSIDSFGNGGALLLLPLVVGPSLASGAKSQFKMKLKYDHADADVLQEGWDHFSRHRPIVETAGKKSENRI